MSANDTVVEDLKKMNRDVCRQLWKVVSVSASPRKLSQRLIYPRVVQSPATGNSKANTVQVDRASEQEARFAYAHLLETIGNYFYSVETPTKHLYKFTGKKHTRARVDMSLYKPGATSFELVANVEFKQASAKDAAVAQDIEKLVHEGIDNTAAEIQGNYFQVFQSADWETVNTYLKKINDAFHKVLQKSDCDNWTLNRCSIVVCLCVLSQTRAKTGVPWACFKHFSYTAGAVSIDKQADLAFKELAKPKEPKLTRANTAEQLQIALKNADWELVTP